MNRRQICWSDRGRDPVPREGARYASPEISAKRPTT